MWLLYTRNGDEYVQVYKFKLTLRARGLKSRYFYDTCKETGNVIKSLIYEEMYDLESCTAQETIKLCFEIGNIIFLAEFYQSM